MADDVLKRAYEFYIGQGLAPHQAAAMASQMMAESGGNPTIQETRADGTPGPGYGAFQWTTPSRRAGLDAFAKERPWIDPKSLEGQLAYSLHEMDTSESGPGKQLYAAKDYRQAVDAATGYTRPLGYDPNNPSAAHNYQGRFNFGASLAGVPQMQGGAPPPMGPPQQVAGNGLLAPAGIGPAPGSNIDAEIADWSKYGAKGDSLLSKGQSAAISSMGKDMVAAGAPKRQGWENLQASVHQPKEMVALPDFSQQLAQSRLTGIGRKKMPWEVE